MSFWNTCALASALLLCASSGAAQQTVNDASVAGRVRDASGAAVQGAAVAARHLHTNAVHETTTDDEGRFRFPALRIGPYELVVSQEGFASAARPLELTAGSAFDVPVTLEVAAMATGLTVRADAPVLDTARSQVATTIGSEAVASLPLNGRQFLDLALLAPSVAPPNINSTQLFAETSAVPGVGLSVGSQRNISNSVVVDGLSANDDAAGLSGMPYAVDAVEQVQVVTSGAQAELGRALGGYVNVVTRSGTNQPRGTAYWYYRGARLNAANPLTGDVLPMSQHQYGGSIGGPLVRDRTFLFANVEQRQFDGTGVATIAPAAAAAINARLDAVGYAGARVATGRYTVPVDTRTAVGKIDHAVSGRSQLALRYSLYDVAAENVRGAGGLAAPSASAGLDNRDQVLAATSTTTLGSRTALETRGQLAHGDLLAAPSDAVGPAVSIAGVATFGTFSSSPHARTNRLLQLVNNVSQHRGAHALRAGADLTHNDDRIVFPRARAGAYTFASLPAFMAGAYNNAGFTQTFGETDVRQGNANLGVFLQDAWSVASGLTINAGLRYDVQWLESIRTDTDNVSPRVGFAWTPSGSSRWVVRGNAGVYVDRVPLRALANALLSAGNTTDTSQLRQTQVSLTPGQAGAPVFPAVLAAPQPSVTLPSLTTMQRDLQNASTRQVNLEVERQLGSRTTLTVSYARVAGKRLLMAINQNVPSCLPAGANNGCRPIGEYANDSRYSSAGSSRYHGLSVTVMQRAASWGAYRATYTLSRARNDVGEFFFSGPIDPHDLSKDWGRADNDRRHLFVLSGGVHTSTAPGRGVWQRFTHGFALGAMLQAYSAAPFTITSGLTTLQGTTGRPVVDGAFIGRNTGVGDSFVTLALRLSRSFPLRGRARVEAIAEAFNATNAVNETARNTNFGTGTYPASPAATFNQVTAVGDPRSAQLALRVRF